MDANELRIIGVFWKPYYNDKLEITFNNKTMRKLLIATICFMFCANAIHAQEKVLNVSLYVSSGVHYFTDLTSINNGLVNSGLPAIQTNTQTSNAGITIDYKRFLIQYDEQQNDLLNSDKGNYKISSSGEGSSLRFGYDLIRSTKFDLYPYVGLGFQNLSWTIDSKTPNTLAQAINTLSYNSYKLSPGVINTGAAGLTFNFQALTFSQEKFSFLIGTDLQYLYCSSGPWRLNEQIVDIQKADLGGFSWMVNIALRADIKKFLRKE